MHCRSRASAIRCLAGMAALLVPLSAAAVAQTSHLHKQEPYASLQSRGIKALSEEQIADLRAGRGMGLALAAELNGYPGPLHVLEHADDLVLTPEQRERTEALFEAMRNEAVLLGERLIEQERELDRLFASRTVEPATLAATTAAIGETQGRLRATHLSYHLAVADMLTPEQVQRYTELRGYSARKAPAHQGHSEPGHGRTHPR